jgi:hypothetical protein
MMMVTMPRWTRWRGSGRRDDEPRSPLIAMQHARLPPSATMRIAPTYTLCLNQRATVCDGAGIRREASYVEGRRPQ